MSIPQVWGIRSQAFDYVFGKEKSKKKGIFRFDRALCKDEKVRELVKSSWNNPLPESVIRKVDRCRNQIIKWTKKNKTNNALHIREIQSAFEKDLSAELEDHILICSISQLNLAYTNEEQYWRQRSRILKKIRLLS